MRITELVLKNFGKFTDKRIGLTDGINIIYGENESGKSTLHTFLKSMLFGIERKRGRAAATDTFSTYEPWENPNYYAGVLRFECGGRHFRLERNFDRYSKGGTLLCEDDGEELSLEHGDLEILLGGMTESDYENTVSVGQLRVQTGSTLAAELKNYAANYYATGNSEIDLEGALAILKERKRTLEKEEREQNRKIDEKREKAELEASYVWRDLHQLEQEEQQLCADCEEKRRAWEVWEKEEKKRRKQEEASGYFDGWRIHPLEAIAMLGLFLVTFVLFPRPWNFPVAIVVALAEGLYVWNHLKDGKKKKKARQRENREQGNTLKAAYEMQKGKLAKVQESYHEKEVLHENLKERVAEFDEMNTEDVERRKRRQGLELAMERLTELASQMQSRTGSRMNAEVSAIMDAITEGKYNRLWVDENLQVQLMSGDRKISMDQVSRGTLEQICFAIRMAATNILHEEECPVILDDAFGYYDDRRLKNTLKWLSENKRQVIILSCQKREMEALEEMECGYHKVVL